MPELASIIIPTYNRAELLGETLDSILSQTYKNWECLVIDDGSGDYTPELMNFYTKLDSRISYHKRPRNRRKGANACRNYGFEISKGNYINWFDDDDLMHPEKLEIQIMTLKNSDKKFSVCQSLFFEEKLTNLSEKPLYKIHSENSFMDYLQVKIKWLTQVPLWKRNFLDHQAYLYDEELHAAQEWEFHCRMLAHSAYFYIVNKPLVYIRRHKESITYNKNDHNRAWNYFFARLKIYRNTDIEMNKESVCFLRNYLIDTFKGMIVNGNPNQYKVYKEFMLSEKHISLLTKVYAIVAMISYKFSDRGNKFLQKIRFDR